MTTDFLSLHEELARRWPTFTHSLSNHCAVVVAAVDDVAAVGSRNNDRSRSSNCDRICGW